MTARLVVLASGNGTNLQAIIDACENTHLDAQVVGVVSDKHEAFALNRAECHNVETAVVSAKPQETRLQYDARLAQIVGAWQPHIVVLAGFMRVLSNSFLSQFPNQVINIHPALPGELPGTHAIERAFTQFTNGTICWAMTGPLSTPSSDTKCTITPVLSRVPFVNWVNARSMACVPGSSPGSAG